MRRSPPKHTECRRRSRGAAAVELAVSLPVLMLLALGCTDLGRAVAAYIAVSNAARVGAEYGATHGYTTTSYSSWQSQVIQQATNEMQGSSAFNQSNLTIEVSTVAEAPPFFRATVTATYAFTMIVPWPGLTQNFNITHSVTVERFR